MSKTNFHGKARTFLCVAKAAALSAFFAANAVAQDMDTAYVPFSVNVNAIATAQLAGGGRFEKPVRNGYTDTLLIITEGTTLASPGKTPKPVTMHSSCGKISLELPRQLYKGADIALYSLNGKQMLHGKASASEAAKSISHPNVAMGVYVLSVKGSNTFTTRLAHGGGGLNINAAFIDGNLSSASPMEKAIPGNWTITVSADGYLDTSYALIPETGKGNIPVQNITLRQSSSQSSSSSEIASSSSSLAAGSSSSSATTSSSSSAPVTLACGTVPASGVSGVAITLPALTCNNGETATGISWSVNAPAWSSPAPGTYSAINATATCGTVSGLTASCSGALAVNPVTLACGSMPSSGISDVAIAPPALTCNNGITPANAAWSASAPAWSSPVHGTYSNVSATADCGTSSGLTAICSGTLTVTATLTCGSMPASGLLISGTAIAPPALTCNNGKTPANAAWSASAPAWSSPVHGTYSNVSATADCGTSSNLTANCSGSLQVYKTVVIGTQTWMAENLNYNVSGSKCYNNLESNCDTYGRLYDWSTAMGFSSSCNSSRCSSQIQTKHKGICPAGWHIPSDAEWTTLTDYVGNSAAIKLKSASGGWGTGGTDNYGFSALPGGRGSGSKFDLVYSYGYWWSATEDDAYGAYEREMYSTSSTVSKYYRDKSFLYSVRCVQD